MVTRFVRSRWPFASLPLASALFSLALPPLSAKPALGIVTEMWRRP